MSSKHANLTFDARSNKWVALFAGKVLSSSPNKEYVINSIRSGRCNRANQFGVSDIIEIVGQFKTNEQTGKVEKQDNFNINERFDFLTNLVEMVAERISPSLVVTGEGGLGKTYTVNKSLKDCGLIRADEEIGLGNDDDLFENESKKIFCVVKGYSTAKGLYRTLYENRNKIVVFDDCDSILRDPVALNLLKGALDSYDRRIISWNAESFSDDDLPRSFEFRGGVIFISNLPLFKIDQAIRSRSLCVDLSMTTDQKIERMSTIIIKEEFMPEFDLVVKQDALTFISEMKDKTKELSLRTLISVVKVASRGGQWKRLAEYVLTAI